MKKLTTIILISILTLLITSCGQEETNKENNKENKVVQQNQIEQDDQSETKLKIENKAPGTTNIYKERKVETKLEDNKLKIGTNVVISEGQTEYIEFDFPVVDGGTIYKNSNVRNYGFIISSPTTDVNYITKFYKQSFKELGWEEYIEQEELEQQDQPERQEEGIIQQDQQESKTNELVFIKKKTDSLYQEVKIKIKEEIPEILKENYNFEGNYIEFYVGTMSKQQDIPEEENFEQQELEQQD